MDQVYQWLDQAFNSGDPEVRTWFLVRNNYLPFILCGSYAIFSSVIGPAIMKNRKPFDLRTIMIVFNFFIVATYTVSLSLFAFHLPQLTWEKFCKGSLVRKGDITYTIVSYGWIVYILKYLEFLDTVFFVLRKKENLITFLHVMHHTVVPILGWIMFRTEKSGFQSIPVILNCIVHVVMYTYYGLAAVGPKVRKYLWWKKYLTQLQMIQFILIIVFVTTIAPVSGCPMVSGYILDITLAPVFLYLFYRYYKKSFLSKQKCLVTSGITERKTLSSGETIKNGEEKRSKIVDTEMIKEE